MASKNTVSTPTWVSNDASSICMKCGAEFGRLLGASRHHCRTCGELICQTCKVEGAKESHVLVPGKDDQMYLAPTSEFELLKRPEPTSMVGSAYAALSSTAHVVKFCQGCHNTIQKEHQAFRMAIYFLNTIKYFSVERQMRFICVAIRAYFANCDEPTGMNVLGRDVVRKLRESFYAPKVRVELCDYDQTLNQMVASFFRVFIANCLNDSNHTTSTVDSIIMSKPNHNFLHHVFLVCLLNGAHIPDIRADTLKYILDDPYRCMHILLSRYVLKYGVTINSIFQVKAWISILSNSNLKLFLEYPLLFSDMIRSSGKLPETDQFTKFLTMNRVVSPSKRNLATILCNCTNDGMLRATCKPLCLDADNTTTLFKTLHSKLLSVIYDTEHLETAIQVPWTINLENTLAKLFVKHPLVHIMRKIYSQEPRTLQVDHVVSKKTHHVARVFQSWYVYCEPNFVMSQAMKHIFDLSTLANPCVDINTPLYDNTNYVYDYTNTNLVLGLVPGTVTESRLVHVDKNTFSQNVETTLHILVTILLIQHLHKFLDVQTHDGLSLVEVGSTERNSVIINAPLTYSSIQAIKTHMLKGSLHAHTVIGIVAALTKIVNVHLPEFYMGLLCLTKLGISHTQIIAYLDDVRANVQNHKVREMVLTYLV